MSVETPAPGRPGEGQVLAAEMASAAQRRERRRDLRPLAGLLPFAARHKGDAVASTFFLLFSTLASLALPYILRLLIDQGVAGHTQASLGRYFLLAAGDAALLAAATAFRFFFITRLGERVVADMRQALYRRVMGLDQ